MQTKNIKIIIGGDLVPTAGNEKLFIDGDVQKLIGDELLNIINNSEFNIYNLEVPLTDKSTPIKKYGPNLIAKTETASGIKKLKPGLLCLANNHILDHGDDGLKSTLEILKMNEIENIGAGENIDIAKKTFIKNINGLKIGVYNCAEHEFTIAGKNRSGANPFDVIESYKHIKELRKDCDYLIVIYHGGKTSFRYTSPNLQKYTRHFVDSGADLVVCQHSHCIGCEEKYNNATIVYGQGNFIFTYQENEFWQTGMLINIEVSKDKNNIISYIPFVKEHDIIRMAKGTVKDQIIDEFMKRSEEIKQNGFIEKKYAEFCVDYVLEFLVNAHSIMGVNKLVRLLWKAARKLFSNDVFTKFISSYNLLYILGIIRCEALHEVFVNGLETMWLQKTRKRGVL